MANKSSFQKPCHIGCIDYWSVRKPYHCSVKKPCHIGCIDRVFSPRVELELVKDFFGLLDKLVETTNKSIKLVEVVFAPPHARSLRNSPVCVLTCFIRPLFYVFMCPHMFYERILFALCSPNNFEALNIKNTGNKYHNSLKMTKQVNEMVSDEEEDEESLEDMITEVKMEAMIPEVKMEVISDEEVDIGEQVQSDMNTGEFSQADFGHNVSPKNPPAVNIMSAIKEHHNISSSFTVPNMKLYEDPANNITHATDSIRLPQKGPMHLIMSSKLSPEVLPLLNNIPMQNNAAEANASIHGLVSNFAIKSIPPFKYSPGPHISVENIQNLLSTVTNLPVVPEFPRYPNFSTQSLPKSKIEMQQMYIKQITSLEEIDFSELCPEDITNGLVFIIYERKKARKHTLSWAGVAEYFRNIFRIPNLTGRQLAASIHRVVKLYELKKSQNVLEEYAISRYYPPSYNDTTLSCAKILSQYGLELSNVPMKMITNKVVWVIFQILLSGKHNNALWTYIHHCISQIFDWTGTQQSIINSIVEVGNNCSRLVSENDYNTLNSYLNQQYIPPIESKNVQHIIHKNDIVLTTVNFENKKGGGLHNTMVKIESECEKFPKEPKLNDGTKYRQKHMTKNITTKDHENEPFFFNKLPTSVGSYLSKELERQSKINIDEKISKEKEIPETQIFSSGIKVEDNENGYESIENLLFNYEEQEVMESFDSKPTIEEYLKLHYDRKVSIIDNDKCTHIKDMIFSSDKEMLVCHQKALYSGNSDTELSAVTQIQKNQPELQKYAVSKYEINNENNSQDSQGIGISKNDLMNSNCTNISPTMNILVSNSKSNEYKRKKINEVKINFLESESKKYRSNSYQTQGCEHFEKVNNLPLDSKSMTEISYKNMVKDKAGTQNLNWVEVFNRLGYPYLTNKKFTNFVACQIYQTIASGDPSKTDLYWTHIAARVGVIFKFPHLCKDEVWMSFQQIYITSEELSKDNTKLNVFLNTLYNPPQRVSDMDQKILNNLNELIKEHFNTGNKIKVLEKSEVILSSLYNDYNITIEDYDNTDNEDNNNNSSNNNCYHNLEISELLLPILSNVTTENFSNRIIYEIYKNSLNLSASMKKDFWSEVRDAMARIRGVSDISVYSVCLEFSQVYQRIMRWKNDPIKFNKYISSKNKCNFLTNPGNKDYIKNVKIVRQLEEQKNMKVHNIENMTLIECEDQCKEKEKYFLDLDILKSKDRNYDFEMLKSYEQCGNLNKQSEAETAIRDTWLSNNVNKQNCFKFESEMEWQHQEMLNLLGLDKLTEDNFINGVAWKIFKNMKMKGDNRRLSWEMVVVFMENIYKVENLKKESLEESFEEIFSHCQLLKAKKEFKSLNNYFSTLYTLPKPDKEVQES
ncbi:unnamed protein product, partial [Meganyctiphanes norvegica]